MGRKNFNIKKFENKSNGSIQTQVKNLDVIWSQSKITILIICHYGMFLLCFPVIWKFSESCNTFQHRSAVEFYSQSPNEFYSLQWQVVLRHATQGQNATNKSFAVESCGRLEWKMLHRYLIDAINEFISNVFSRASLIVMRWIFNSTLIQKLVSQQHKFIEQ